MGKSINGKELTKAFLNAKETGNGCRCIFQKYKDPFECKHSRAFEF